MNRLNIGIVFIMTGFVYALFAWDFFYENTLGWLVKHDFVKPKFLPPKDMPKMGRKATILFYGMVLMLIGFYIIFFSQI